MGRHVEASACWALSMGCLVSVRHFVLGLLVPVQRRPRRSHVLTRHMFFPGHRASAFTLCRILERFSHPHAPTLLPPLCASLLFESEHFVVADSWQGHSESYRVSTEGQMSLEHCKTRSWSTSCPGTQPW